MLRSSSGMIRNDGRRTDFQQDFIGPRNRFKLFTLEDFG
jgi:hypothetical protein